MASPGMGGDVDVANHGVGVGNGETASLKSWALQTQESYQLQLALALRLSSQASSAEDPNFLDFNKNHNHNTDSHLRGRIDSSSDSPQSISHRFWVNGCLSYSDKISDGFYLIHGMDPYAWNISTDLGSSGRIPTLESLMDIDPRKESSIKVVLVDGARDPGLKELQNWVNRISGSWISTVDVIQQLANIVCNRMGGIASSEDEVTRWYECNDVLSDCLGSIVIPIGYLSTGICVHRALLFKILADIANLPCRIVKGCKYCNKDVGASCLVQFGLDKEYLVDLLGMPGVLSQPDSSFNNVSSILVSSPLCHPRFKSGKTAQGFRTLAQLYFFDCQSLALALDDTSSGTAGSEDKNDGPHVAEAFVMNQFNWNNHVPTSAASPFLQRATWNSTGSRDHRRLVFSDPSPNIMNSTHLIKEAILPRHIQQTYHRVASPAFSNIVPNTVNTLLSSNQNQLVQHRPSRDFYLGAEDSDIQWNELVLKTTIGSGSFGTVYCADWRDSEVAVKILKEQDFVANNFEEFLKEVAIMKRLHHPNIVSFLGAITQPPNLSIVTEYLSNGCLYKLLRRPDAGVLLDERLRLNMACDVAKGMNYLHQLQPPIVHRDLKSPNLLVDSKFIVKVCDFGLSRSKANTFLSSKTAAGTPEWMAPEVLRDEPSNEKSDVYSFGVILWELMTLQQPWSNLSSAQVVAAVGFKNKRLEIPINVNPRVAALIEICWANEPNRRPSFSYIIEALQQLILNCPRAP